jgi:hypothetical protein
LYCVQVVQPKIRRFIVAEPGGDYHVATVGREPWIFLRALRLPKNTLAVVRAHDNSSYAAAAGT